MNQIMQKQRSPYTGGAFNVQQLKNNNYGKTDGLNGMPFLVQLAKETQRPIQRLGSPPPSSQPFTKFGAGHERGLRSGTPRSYATESINSNSISNNLNNNINLCNLNNKMNGINHGYEGEIPILPLGQNYNNSTDDFNHNLPHLDTTLDSLDTPAQLEHLGSVEQLHETSADLMRHGSGETDSESEYCQHRKDFGISCRGRLYWRGAFECLKARMPAQRQERMEMTLRECNAHSVLDHVLLLLQLFRILFFGALGLGLRMGINFGQTSYRLWRCKFQLRGIVRQFLWRMANAKGNDVLLFLGIMLITPWIFLLSLVGFLVSTLFHLKTGLGASWRQMRLQVMR